jgi:hypothetical protein
MSVAVVKPEGKDRLVITLSPGYRAVTFNLANGGAECIILDRDSTETTRLAVAPPDKGYKLEVNLLDEIVEIVYRKAT